MRNIAAHTKAGEYAIPPYISINRMGHGLINITIRDVACQQATISLTQEEWEEIARPIAEDYANGHA